MLFWIKHFLANKITTVSTAKTNDDFDMAALVQAMLSDSTDTIKKVVEVTRKAQSQGLTGLKRPASNIVKLYSFIERNADSFPALTAISIATVDHFAYKDNENISEASREAMFDIARNFFNFIDGNTLRGEHLFGISRGTRGRGKRNSSFSKKTQQRVIKYLSEEEMHRYSKAILKIEYRDEVERNRDILIGRLLLFSGITVSELIALEDDDLVQEQKENDILWVNVKRKGVVTREIPTPRRNLIEYLNTYKKARGVSLNGKLFHSPRDTQHKITEGIIRGVLKQQFKVADIDVKKATPTVMRNSFGIFIYRKMLLDGNHNADRYVQKAMGHADVQTTRNLVKADGIQSMKVATAFSNFDDY